MIRTKLIWFGSSLIIVVIVSVVGVCGYHYGILRAKQKLESKAGIDLVSAGDTPLTDESTADETGDDSDKSEEKHQRTPGEMQKLMQESGANDDGPGPGYDAKSDPFNGGENSGISTDQAMLPVGLSFEYRTPMKANSEQPSASCNVHNISGGVIPGGTRIKVKLDNYLQVSVGGFNPLGLSPSYMPYGHVEPGEVESALERAMTQLFNEGLEVPRLLPGDSTGYRMLLDVDKSAPQDSTEPLHINYFAKGKMGTTWQQVGVAEVWY